MMRRTPAVVLLVAAMVLAVAAPVCAHTPSPARVDLIPSTLSETLTAAAPEPALPWTAVAALVTILLAGAWRPRRAIALALVLVIALFAFESGLHSTHHLGQADESRCVVAGVSAQLSGDLVEVAVDPLLSRVPDAVAVSPLAPAVTTRLVAPDAGRAPPFSSV